MELPKKIELGRGYTLSQQNFINDFINPRILFQGGFGCGKSFAGAEHGNKLHIYNGHGSPVNGMHIAPTYDLCDLVLLPAYSETLDYYGIRYEYKKSYRSIITDFGKIYLRSGANPERIVGVNLGWVGIDEPFLMKKEAYLKSVARLRDQNAWIKQLFMTGTPEQIDNWGYDIVYDEKTPFEIYNSSTLEAVEYGIQSADYVNNLLNDYDIKLIRAYLLGKFVNLQSNILYYNFDDKKHVKELWFEEKLPILLAMDFNVNPISWLVLQQHNNQLWVIDEICINNSDTKEAMTEFLNRYEKKIIDNNLIVYLFGDASARARNTVDSKVTDLIVIKNMLRRKKMQYVNFINKFNPPVRAAINNVNALLHNANGEIRLLIDKKCKRLIKDLVLADYKPGTFIPNKEKNERSLRVGHMRNALEYCGYKIYGKENERRIVA